MIFNYTTSHWKHYVFHPILFIRDIYSDIREFFQRGSRGYANADLWWFHGYIAEVLFKVMTQFREIENGIPPNPDRPGKFYTEKQWDNILDKIIDGFKTVSEEEEDSISGDRKGYMKRCNNRYRRLKKAFELFSKNFNAFWT